MSKQKKIRIDDFAFADLSNVAEGYQFWCRTLLEKASNKYEYFTNDGTELPKNLNFGALQQCAVWNGMAPVIDYKKLGLVATCNTPMYIGGSLTGYDINGLSVIFTCANPSLPAAGTFSIYPQCERAPAFPELPKKCVVLYNSTIDKYGGYYGNSGLKMSYCNIKNGWIIVLSGIKSGNSPLRKCSFHLLTGKGRRNWQPMYIKQLCIKESCF